MVVLFLIFLKDFQNVLHCCVPFCIPMKRCALFQFFTSLTALIIFCFLNYSILTSVKWYLDFDVHFPDNWLLWAFFMHLLGICISSLEKRLFEFFLGLLEGFFFLCCWTVRILCIFRRLTPYHIIYSCKPCIWFANISSHSIRCLFTVDGWLMVPLCRSFSLI